MKIFKILIFLLGVYSISAQSPNTFKKEIRTELNEILSYWEKNSVDIAKGGFYGAVDVNNVPNTQADKGLILNSRILWTFSAAYQMDPKPGYKKLADRAFNYLNTYFWDTKHKGAYWSVKSNGTPSDTHKQVYTEGFSERMKLEPGLSPINFLIKIRINIAMNLMATFNYKIGDIAYETGFYSPQHFSLTFKKMTGVSPHKYRKTYYEKQL